MRSERILGGLDMSFSEWREVKLEDIIEIEMGQSPKSEFYNQTGEGLPFLQGNRTFGDKYPYFDTYCTENKKIANKNDVIMSVRAPVGDLNIAQTQISLGRGVCAMRLKGEQNSNYLFYLMKHNIKEMINRESGTVFGSVNKKDILGLDVKITNNKLEQKAIAHILSTLDDKIEVNNQINKTLENMAQAIFKQWFVDFEFPNEDGEPYKSSGGEMVESELGMIPRGWEVGVLGDIISISSGKRPKKKSKEPYEEFVIPLIGASSTMGYVKEYNYFEPIIIIGRVGTHGVVQRFKDKVWASDNTLVIKSEYYEYVHQLLGLIDYASLNRGSTQPLITQTDIKNVRILIPYKSILNQYEELVGKLYELVNSRLDENSNLINLRDTLLPKLMSGEIRVPLDEEGEVS
jgi:type I restriction enzyme S subunit